MGPAPAAWSRLGDSQSPRASGCEGLRVPSGAGSLPTRQPRSQPLCSYWAPWVPDRLSTLAQGGTAQAWWCRGTQGMGTGRAVCHRRSRCHEPALPAEGGPRETQAQAPCGTPPSCPLTFARTPCGSAVMRALPQLQMEWSRLAVGAHAMLCAPARSQAWHRGQHRPVCPQFGGTWLIQELRSAGAVGRSVPWESGPRVSPAGPPESTLPTQRSEPHNVIKGKLRHGAGKGLFQ